MKYYRKTNIVLGETLYCAYCGKPFKRKSWNSKYCSFECKQKDYKEKDKKDKFLSWFDLEFMFKAVKKGSVSVERFEHELNRTKRLYVRRDSAHSLEILLSLEKKFKKWLEGKDDE